MAIFVIRNESALLYRTGLPVVLKRGLGKKIVGIFRIVTGLHRSENGQHSLCLSGKGWWSFNMTELLNSQRALAMAMHISCVMRV